jgi:hypothetical protein
VLIDYDVENTPLEIKTNSEVGSNEKMDVYFRSAQGIIAFQIVIFFKSTVQYWIGYCSTSAKKFPTTLPSAKEKVFRITLNRKSGIRLKIECNEEEMVNVLISGTTCTDSRWSKYWSRDVEKIQFFSDDTASDGYRSGKKLSYYHDCVIK